MKIKREIQAVCLSFGETASGYQSTWEEIQALGITHSVGAVVRDFEDWMRENQGDTFYKGPVTAYLAVAHDRLNSNAVPATAALKDPEVSNLARELSYLSDGQISFMDKQRVRLAEVLKEFSAAEITSAFKTWLQDQDLSDPKNIQYAPGKFVQIVDSLCYAAQKRKREQAEARIARTATLARIQAEAQAERDAKPKEPDFDPLENLL